MLGLNNLFLNADCMNKENGMPSYPDKYFDLAIVDPPYGVGDFQQSDGNYTPVKWNENTPGSEYFDELNRVSKNQIIWGANYYNCFSGSGGAVIWDKLNVHPSMSRCEIASCSLQKRITYFNYEWHGYVVKRVEPDSFHPCQKPIALYKWLLSKYAKPNDKILDTHVGSASSLIAFEDMGFEYVGYEIDKDYFDSAQKRLTQFRSQLKLALAI